MQLAAEVKNDGSVSEFVFATSVNSADYMKQGSSHYRLIHDHLGSPRLVVNSLDGTIMQRLDYNEWGNVIADSNPNFQPFGFAGGLYDADTKLTKFGARDYNPSVARWNSKDPILFAGGDTNLYRYNVSDSINLIDPEGTEPIAITLLTISAIDIALALGLTAAAAWAVDEIINVFSQRGDNNHKIDSDQRARLEEKLKDPTISKAERSSILKKLSKDDKARGKKRRRKGVPGNEHTVFPLLLDEHKNYCE